jgi:hypothetical protein
VAANLIKEYHPRYIEENLSYALRMSQGDSNIDNISGYIVKAIQHNYADSSYQYVEDAYESTLYSIAASDYVQKLKERTEEDIARIKELIEHYELAMIKAGENYDFEEIKRLSKQRNEQLYKLFDEIQEFRQKHIFPFLTENDFKDEKSLLSYFQNWKKRRESQFSLSYDLENEDIKMIEGEDIPY